mmetsp:Transcript_40471/g.120726  ORF Transcript_40471/g.120726 Transcript_40471/m.120726 type:complete len:506 (+) Transcript_40471:132-1649(+)
MPSLMPQRPHGAGQLSALHPTRGLTCLVDVLHRRGGNILLKRRQVVDRLGLLSILVNAEAELDHAVDAAGKCVGLLKAEARRKQRRLEQKHHEVLDGAVRLVRVRARLKLRHDGVVRVELERLLRCHVRRHGVVPQRLRLHDALHVGAPAVLARHQHARRVDDAVRHKHLLNLVAKDVLDDAAQRLEAARQLLTRLLLVLSLVKLEALLGAAHKLLTVVLLELLHSVLVDRVHHKEHLVALTLELLQEGRVLNRLLGLTGNVVHVSLALLHTGHIVLEAGRVLTALGGVEAQQLSQLGAVLRVGVHAQLEVLAKCFVKLVVVVLVLSNLGEHVEALLHDVLLDDLEDLVLLQRLARDVERQVLTVDDALDKAEVVRDEVLAVVHDEHAAHIQLDVVQLLLLVKHVERCTARHKQNRLELQLPLNTEVLDRKVLLPVVRDRLVEGSILLLGDLVRVAHPDGLLLVQEVPLVLHLLDLLGLLLLHLLNLALLLLAFLLICLLLSLVI